MATIPPYSFTIANGQTADGGQVMTNFNTIRNGAISNCAALGANSDITSLTGLTTPLSPAQGGSPLFVGGVSTGSANAQVLATTLPNSFSLTPDYVVTFIAGFTNTGSATLNVNSTGATTIQKTTPSGLANLAANDIILTGVYTVIYNGTVFVLITTTPVATPQLNITSFTASGNFATPSNLTAATIVKFTVVGGGGGGGGSATSGDAGAGGGAGACAIYSASGLVASTNYAITVGAGGGGGANTGANGASGANSLAVIGATTVTGGGGGGGTGGTNADTGSLGGLGGTATSGNIANAAGGDGQCGGALAGTAVGGTGGASFAGGGGRGGNNGNAGRTAVCYGGGGGGGAGTSGGGQAGGSGAGGLVIVEYVL